MSSRARPASVPAEAAWSNEEQAWIHTALDDEDRQHGLFRAWLADGALAERSLYRHGQRHGLQVFYRVEPPRWAVLSRVHQDIARVELTAADGNFGARRYFDGDDQEVNERGVRVPPRPEGVSEGASYIGQSSDCWVEFSPRPAGATRVAGSRSWDAAGVLRRSRNWDGEGWSRSYHANGALAEEGQRDDNGLQHGPWRTYRDDGSWQETEHFVRGELTRRSEHIPAGRYLDARVTHRAGAVQPLGAHAGFLRVGRWTLHGDDDDEGELGALQLGSVGDDDTLLGEALADGDGPATDGRLPAILSLMRKQPALSLCAVVRALGAGDPDARAAFDTLRAAREQLTAAGRRAMADEIIAAFDDWRQHLSAAPLKDLLDGLLWGAEPAPLLLTLASLLLRVGHPRRAHDFLAAAELVVEGDNDDEEEKTELEGYRQRIEATRALILRDLGDHDGAERARQLGRRRRISSEELRLLSAIAVTPDADEPRLVYADWLTQRDDPRGAFIVAQCQLAALAESEQQRREHLERTQQQIFEQNAGAWLPPADLDLRTFHRGMLGAIAIPGDAFCDDPDALYRLAPDMRMLCIDTPYDPIRLSKTPELLRYRGFDLSDAFVDSDDYRHLAASPFFANIEALRFYNASLGDEDLAAFCRSPHLARLRSLDISCHRDNDVTVEGIRALVSSPTIAALAELDVSRLWLDAEALALLCRAENMRELRELRARCNRFGAACGELARFEGRLRVLDLSHNDVDERGLRLLVAAESLCELDELYLSANALGDAGARVIAEAPLLAGLSVLELDAGLRHRAGAVGASAIAAAPTLAALRSLSLSMNEIGDEGAIALAAGEIIALQRLDLYQNGIGDEGAIALAGSEVLRGLRWLNLDANNIGQRGARALARSTTLSRDCTVRLAGNDVPIPLREALQERFAHVTFRYPWGGPD